MNIKKENERNIFPSLIRLVGILVIVTACNPTLAKVELPRNVEKRISIDNINFNLANQYFDKETGVPTLSWEEDEVGFTESLEQAVNCVISQTGTPTDSRDINIITSKYFSDSENLKNRVFRLPTSSKNNTSRLCHGLFHLLHSRVFPETRVALNEAIATYLEEKYSSEQDLKTPPFSIPLDEVASELEEVTPGSSFYSNPYSYSQSFRVLKEKIIAKKPGFIKNFFQEAREKLGTRSNPLTPKEFDEILQKSSGSSWKSLASNYKSFTLIAK